MTLHFNEHHAHIGVDEHDVGLMLALAVAHADAGDDQPVAVEAVDE